MTENTSLVWEHTSVRRTLGNFYGCHSLFCFPGAQGIGEGLSITCHWRLICVQELRLLYNQEPTIRDYKESVIGDNQA